MRRGRHVTIYLDESVLVEIDRLINDPGKWLWTRKGTAPCNVYWRSRSRFMTDACIHLLRAIKPSRRRRA